MLQPTAIDLLICRGYSVRSDSSTPNVAAWVPCFRGQALDLPCVGSALAWEVCREHNRKTAPSMMSIERQTELMIQGFSVQPIAGQPGSVVLFLRGTRAAGPYSTPDAAWMAADTLERAWPRPVRP